MVWPAAVALLAALVLPGGSAARQPGCVCIELYAPVCGADGITYSNSCFASSCAGVAVAYDGPCTATPPSPPVNADCFCPLVYLPVCGADGKTYGNACEAGCAKVAVLYDGECKAPPPGSDVCICPFIYLPVCGADGKTYGNACAAGCAKVKVLYSGECKAPPSPRRAPKPPPPAPPICICNKIFLPVCGVNGNTYPNDCYLKCANVRQAYPGPCISPSPPSPKPPPPSPKPPRPSPKPPRPPPSPAPPCSFRYSPVCGSDNVTYPNACAAKQANVTIAKLGKCTRCPTGCGCAGLGEPCFLAAPKTVACCNGTNAPATQLLCRSGPILFEGQLLGTCRPALEPPLRGR